ncbi:UvrD-helicase domain-containing protein [Azospirillum sp. HJ39]|uniref:UvrD-helicase domain-containing protein n=1 Tax=Azospirillum sp. HJ39 TaxID=3159496 RepID=UPI003557BD48
MSEFFSLPVINDADIFWIEEALGLRFAGERRDVLQALDSGDVEACPGSGKTTLLVAKLAILARKWTARSRGICVLSYTTVARDELEKGVQRVPEAARLLTYPHYVGTIHGFVNSFLALPYLRSYHMGPIGVRFIDDDRCRAVARRIVWEDDRFEPIRKFAIMRAQSSSRKATAGAPKKTAMEVVSELCDALEYRGAELGLDLSAFQLKDPKLPTYEAMTELRRRLRRLGYFFHNDMFAFGERLVAEAPQYPALIRHRFPCVFMDEMQDTQPLHAAMLSRLFPKDACALRQRFGDSDQAIYDGDRGEPEAVPVVDAFPDAQARSLPRSNRFGGWIAARASAVAPSRRVMEGDALHRWGTLKGEPTSSRGHTIFLFGPEAMHERPLQAFGALLCREFDGDTLHHGVFTAIGRVHAPPGQRARKADQLPHSVRDYWNRYEPDTSRRTARPRVLADYLCLAHHRRTESGELGPAITELALGLIHLLEACGAPEFGTRHNPLRQLRAYASERPALWQAIHKWLWDCATMSTPPNPATWPVIRVATEALVRSHQEGGWHRSRQMEPIDAFLAWPEEAIVRAPEQPPRHLYVHQGEDGRSVNIRLGSIHSVKGQTHTATLILDTFFHSCHIGRHFRLLAGRKSPMALDAQRLLYVAMTRPSHLLCVALRASHLGEGKAALGWERRLQDVGWRIEHIAP